MLPEPVGVTLMLLLSTVRDVVLSLNVFPASVLLIALSTSDATAVVSSLNVISVVTTRLPSVIETPTQSSAWLVSSFVRKEARS